MSRFCCVKFSFQWHVADCGKLNLMCAPAYCIWQQTSSFQMHITIFTSGRRYLIWTQFGTWFRLKSSVWPLFVTTAEVPFCRAIKASACLTQSACWITPSVRKPCACLLLSTLKSFKQTLSVGNFIQIGIFQHSESTNTHRKKPSWKDIGDSVGCPQTEAMTAGFPAHLPVWAFSHR